MAFQKIKSVPPENALNAVIYARYSSAQQTENSIDGQLRECNRFADLHGYRIIGTYIDRAKSITHLDAIRDAESLAGSDSSHRGELESNLSEHVYMIYEQGAIGCVIKIER